MKRGLLFLANFLIFSSVLFALVYFYLYSKDKSPPSFLSPLADNSKNYTYRPFFQIGEILGLFKNEGGLKKVLEEELLKKEGVYGVVVKNLKNNETYLFNENQKFETASLYKLWVMATSYKLIEEGKLKEEEILTQEIPFLNEKFNIATESAEKTEGTITLSVDDALELMITQSDNYAALLLLERVGSKNLEDFLKTYGFLNSHIGQPPETTPLEISLFLEKLYKAELANQGNTEKMLNLLKRQVIKNKLAKYLPEETLIAHKTGELGFFSHDAGIVYLPNNEYVIVVMSETKDQKEANEFIATLSKKIYEYFLKN